MARYLLLRIANNALLLFVAVSLAWVLAQTQLHPRALFELRTPPVDPTTVENMLRAANVSDQVPLWDRYVAWLGGLLHGDWGSVPGGGSISAEIGRRMWVSFRLVTLGWLLSTVVGVALGAWTAVRQYRLADRVVTAVVLMLVATPAYVTGQVATMVALWVNKLVGHPVFLLVGEVSSGTLPTYPFAALVDRVQHLVVPTVVLTLLGIGSTQRLQRSLMLDALGSDYVRTARAKGLRENQAVVRHALRTALIPTGTYFAFQAAAVFVGATYTERIFAFQGMGIYGIDTIAQQNVNGVVAVTAFGGLCYLVGAFLADVMVGFLDPRVRLS